MVITVDALTKVYPLYDRPVDRLKESFGWKKGGRSSFTALSSVSFTIGKGETVGIIGKNGSGKSTLLKAITGVIKPTKGTVEVQGKVAAILELGTGFNPEYTGMENIYLAGTIQGLTRTEVEAVVPDIVRFADIGSFIHQPMKTYSSGMFARLAFSVNVHLSPDVLIVDEALAVGDVRFNAKCMERFKQLKENGTTILYVTHDVTSVRSFCDRAIWIHEGKVRASGDPDTITADYLAFMHQDGQPEREPIQAGPPDDAMVFDPIQRWGSDPHLIHSVRLYGADGAERTHWVQGERVMISLRFALPEGVDHRSIGAGIAIKHTTGLDIQCMTTFDGDPVSFSSCGPVAEVTFSFTNWLNQGAYHLAASVETRASGEPVYYDFIEGCAYVDVSTNQKRYGLMNPPVTCHIRGGNA